MASDGDPEPPARIAYDLEEALDLLVALEEARATLLDTEHLAGVLMLEGEIEALVRKLGFDDGGTDAG